MNIQVFIESNRCELRKIYLESRKQVFNWQNSKLFTLNDFDRDTEGEAIWVATDNNGPIGFISVWKPNNFIHTSRFCWPRCWHKVTTSVFKRNWSAGNFKVFKTKC